MTNYMIILVLAQVLTQTSSDLTHTAKEQYDCSGGQEENPNRMTVEGRVEDLKNLSHTKGPK